MPVESWFRRFVSLVRPERGHYALGLLSLFAVNLSDVLAPLFMAIAVDLTESKLTGSEPSTPPLLAAIGLNAAMFGIAGAIAVFLILQVTANAGRYPMLMMIAVPSHRIGQRLRNALAAKLFALTRPWYDRARTGDVMSIATSDVQAIRMMFGPGVLVGADTLFLVTLVLIVLFSLSVKLTLIALIPLPIVALVTNKLSHMEFKRFEAVQGDLAKLTERARESFAGIRILQGYARESFDRKRFEDYSWRQYLRNLRLARVRSVFMPALDMMLGASTVLVLIFGGLEVAHGTMSVGTFVAFTFLVGNLTGPMIGFGWSVSLFQRGRASLGRLDTLLNENIDIVDGTKSVDGPGRIEVRDLTYRYAGAPPRRDVEHIELTADGGIRVDRDKTPDDAVPAVPDENREAALDNVSFTLEPGRTLGLLGAVGSGKSTIASLLVRLYDPPAGTILVDGVDLRDYKSDELRKRIVLAPQDTWLFSDTVGRNILLAVEGRGDPVPFAALAQVHDEIDAFPAGYQTMLGERGVNMSGGQRQRTAIARAIAADPKVLILDDCLSAVDARTEAAILSRLREVFAGRSGIIISHRVAAVQSCDEILVMEHGKIVERGTHEQLMAAGGYYATTARAQSDVEAA